MGVGAVEPGHDYRAIALEQHPQAWVGVLGHLRPVPSHEDGAPRVDEARPEEVGHDACAQVLASGGDQVPVALGAHLRLELIEQRTHVEPNAEIGGQGAETVANHPQRLCEVQALPGQ